jgi:hypothetical protein
MTPWIPPSMSPSKVAVPRAIIWFLERELKLGTVVAKPRGQDGRREIPRC